jgi:hypothetical protein
MRVAMVLVMDVAARVAIDAPIAKILLDVMKQCVEFLDISLHSFFPSVVMYQVVDVIRNRVHFKRFSVSRLKTGVMAIVVMHFPASICRQIANLHRKLIDMAVGAKSLCEGGR